MNCKFVVDYWGLVLLFLSTVLVEHVKGITMYTVHAVFKNHVTCTCIKNKIPCTNF